MIWHIFKSWHGHLARDFSKYYMGGTPMPLRMCQVIFPKTARFACRGQEV
jgi:hypothetical protein